MRNLVGPSDHDAFREHEMVLRRRLACAQWFSDAFEEEMEEELWMTAWRAFGRWRVDAGGGDTGENAGGFMELT